jgi:hypothetical protein
MSAQFPNYKELMVMARRERKWRKANPDRGRCHFCHGSEFRTVNIEYTIKDDGKAKGRTIGKVVRPQILCTRCYPV